MDKDNQGGDVAIARSDGLRLMLLLLSPVTIYCRLLPTLGIIWYDSEPGMLNVSSTTYELVKDKFRFTYRGELEVEQKGRMPMYFVEEEIK